MIRSVLTAWLTMAAVIGTGLASQSTPGTPDDSHQQKPEDPKKPEPKKPEDPKKPDEPKKPETPKKPDEPKKPAEEAKKPADETKIGFPKKAAAKQSKIRPYDEIVTAEHKSEKGLVFVHRLEEKLLYEIPADVLGKDILWVTQIEKTGTGSGYAGSPAGDRVVRFEQRGDDVLLRDVKYDIRADTKDPIKNAVEASSVEPIISVLPIKAYGKDKAPVVDVTELFTSDMPEFSAARRLGAQGADPRKTFIESVKAFPENIETKVLMTFRKAPGGFMLGGPVPKGMPFNLGAGGSVTALIHHSIVKLPEEPMKPRKADDRVGFFTEDFQDFGDIKNHQVENVKYITRWRLEKKDPAAEVSEPKKPIVFYVGREVPEKLKPFVKKGIEMWQPAFEKAGFRNAILAKDAPTPREDPHWDAEDARYSTIRWLPSTIENAMGPHVHDPRTGEILEADILMYHNVLKLARDWYFVQASPSDPKAQQLPLPDELVGELLQYVVAHEVGHTLGFPHNMKASSSFTVAQLRDPKFTAENGTEASIMDYGRFNYVAQPGDGARLIPKIGPYDLFATEWGYKEFRGTDTFEKEKAELDKIVARQVKDATLRFGSPTGSDPSSQTEDLSSDAVAAGELGLKNIDRVAGYLVKATAKKGEDYEQLQNMYTQLVAQRGRELMHVASLVGGSVEANIWFGDADHRYDPVPGPQQRKAVAFLVENAFQTPKSLIAPDILRRLEPGGAADRILNSQSMMLRVLMNETRLKRLAEQVACDPTGSYPPADLMADVRNGIWAELKAGTVEIDLYRRNLQRAFLEILINAVNQDSTSDLPGLARGELKALLEQIGGALAHGKLSPTTKVHLEDAQVKIAQALQPKAIVQPSGPSPMRIIFGVDADKKDGEPGSEPIEP